MNEEKVFTLKMMRVFNGDLFKDSFQQIHSFIIMAWAGEKSVSGNCWKVDGKWEWRHGKSEIFPAFNTKVDEILTEINFADYFSITFWLVGIYSLLCLLSFILRRIKQFQHNLKGDFIVTHQPLASTVGSRRHHYVALWKATQRRRRGEGKVKERKSINAIDKQKPASETERGKEVWSESKKREEKWVLSLRVADFSHHRHAWLNDESIYQALDEHFHTAQRASLRSFGLSTSGSEWRDELTRHMRGWRGEEKNEKLKCRWWQALE